MGTCASTRALLYNLRSMLAEAAPRIVLELTERSDLAEIKDSLGRIARVREMGYRIAIDDLGAGWSLRGSRPS